MAIQTIFFKFLTITGLVFGSNLLAFSNTSSGTGVENIGSSCLTETVLDFTEREACIFLDMAEKINEMRTANEGRLSFSTPQTEQALSKTNSAGSSLFITLAKLENAKSLLLEQSSFDTKKQVDLILLEASVEKMSSSITKEMILNQSIINNMLIKREDNK